MTVKELRERLRGRCEDLEVAIRVPDGTVWKAGHLDSYRSPAKGTFVVIEPGKDDRRVS